MSEGQIRVECECGKAARVPARFAGRQVKCGGCGSSLKIPDLDDEPGDDYEDEDSDRENLRAKAPKKRTRTGRSKTGARGTGRAPTRSKGKGSRVGSRVGAKRKKAGTSSGAGRRPPSSEEGESDDPYAPSRAVLRDGAKRRGRRRERGGKRLLATEGHICAIGIWNAIGGVFAAFLGLLLLAGGGIMGQAGAGGGAVTLVGAISLLTGVASVGTGIGLMLRRSWARIGYTVVTAISLLGTLMSFAQNPSQVVFNIPGLMYTIAIFATLYGQSGSKIFARGYLDSIASDRRSLPWAPSPFFWIPLVLIVLAVLLGILVALAAAS